MDYSFIHWITLKNKLYSFKENIHSSEKWIIAQGYLKPIWPNTTKWTPDKNLHWFEPRCIVLVYIAFSLHHIRLHSLQFFAMVCVISFMSCRMILLLICWELLWQWKGWFESCEALFTSIHDKCWPSHLGFAVVQL